MGERMFSATKIREAIEKVKAMGFYASALEKLEEELGLNMTEEEHGKQEDKKEEEAKTEEKPPMDEKSVFGELDKQFKV